MPRPLTVTDADIARWRGTLAEYLLTPEGRAMIMFRDEPLIQVWFAAEWLGEQLETAGVPVRDREDICFAAGQRMAFRPDPWPIAEAALKKWREGRQDKPGEELAAKLVDDVFGSLEDE